MDVVKYAAVDIGSSAIRLLIKYIVRDGGEWILKKYPLIRVPVRLGADVFSTGKISDENIYNVELTVKAFKYLMWVHKVKKYRVCATSAMRDAANGRQIVDTILEKTGVNIDIISGSEEADIIFSYEFSRCLDSQKNYVYIDVGGGSTEFIIFSKGKRIISKSFQLGTLRFVDGNMDRKVWDDVKEWLKGNTRTMEDIIFIGSGGNITKLYKMLAGKQQDRILDWSDMKKFYTYLKSMTYQEKVLRLELHKDRADVIVPATKIYVKTMKWAKSKKMIVPKIGLSDGIISKLCEQDRR